MSERKSYTKLLKFVQLEVENVEFRERLIKFIKNEGCIKCNVQTVDGSSASETANKYQTRQSAASLSEDNCDPELPVETAAAEKNTTRTRQRRTRAPHAKKVATPNSDGYLRNLVIGAKKSTATAAVNPAKQQSPTSVLQSDESSLDSMKAMQDINNDFSLPDMSTTLITKDHVMRQFTIEFESASQTDMQGYLPLHCAAEDGDVKRIHRQLYVYKFRKMHVDVPTRSGETALQLAIIANEKSASSEIINILLQHNASVICQNSAGDSALTLAAYLLTDVKVFTSILSKAKFESLTACNDDGLTLLHICVKVQKFDFCRALLDFIDKKLAIQSPKFHTKDELIRHYKDVVQQYSSDDSTVQQIRLAEDKATILNCRDRKSGRTPLFYAIQAQHQDICLLLAANLADPRVEDFSGTNSFALAAEYISNTMIADTITNLDCAHKKMQKNSKRTKSKRQQSDVMQMNAKKIRAS